MSFLKVFIKKKAFKKPSLELPEDFVNGLAKDGNAGYTVYMTQGKDTITLSSKLPDPGNKTFTLKPAGVTVTYKDAIGFFEFKGDVFYRAKGAAGKNIYTDESFTDYIKVKHDEFVDLTSKDISTLTVQPLIVVQ